MSKTTVNGAEGTLGLIKKRTFLVLECPTIISFEEDDQMFQGLEHYVRSRINVVLVLPTSISIKKAMSKQFKFMKHSEGLRSSWFASFEITPYDS